MYGLIAAPVAEFELVRCCAQRQAQELVAQTDSKYRLFANEFFQCFLRVGNGFRITRAIADKYAIGLKCENVLGCCGGGDNRYAAAALRQIAENIAFGSAINGDNMMIGGAMMIGSLRPDALILGPMVNVLWRNLLHQIHAHQAGPGIGLCHKRGIIGYQRRIRTDHALEGTLRAELANQCPRINTGNSRYVVPRKIRVQRFNRPVIAGQC